MPSISPSNYVTPKPQAERTVEQQYQLLANTTLRILGLNGAFSICRRHRFAQKSIKWKPGEGEEVKMKNENWICIVG